MPVYAQAASALPATFASAWARLLRRAVLGEAQALAPPSATPLHLRDVPELPDSDSSSFLRALLAPARSGLLITRRDLSAAAASAGACRRAGSRAFTLRALIEQDREATFAWLAQRAAWWVARHEADTRSLAFIAQHWLGRAQASQRALAQLSQHA